MKEIIKNNISTSILVSICTCTGKQTHIHCIYVLNTYTLNYKDNPSSGKERLDVEKNNMKFEGSARLHNKALMP